MQSFVSCFCVYRIASALIFSGAPAMVDSGISGGCQKINQILSGISTCTPRTSVGVTLCIQQEMPDVGKFSSQTLFSAIQTITHGT
jgi:hypothetical protein